MTPTGARQLELYGRAALALDETFAGLRHTLLPPTGTREDEAWVDHVPGWLDGHDVLFEHLRERVAWRAETRLMYGRKVLTPRLIGTTTNVPALHAILERARVVLSRRYGEAFTRVSFAFYRDGNDSVALHGDTIARDLPRALVATLSLGAPRRLALRPTEPSASTAISPFVLSGGDLFVMGGSTQRTWRHGIAKVAHAGPRLAVMFRPVWTPP